MTIALRWLLRLVTATLILAVLSGAVVWWMASRSLPDFEADWTVQGITAPVEIVRAQSSVPHIFGETDDDVLFALGFAHAQDRLWQMLMMRRTAQGRLSELFGPRTLLADDLLRRLDLDGYASRSLAALDPETRTSLSAYSAGVNAWLGLVSQEALGRGAPELFLFEPEIAPWRPADSVAVSFVMALQLATHHEEEVLRARTSLALGDPARLADIMPDAPGTGVAALPEYSSLFDAPLPRFAANTSPPADPLYPTRPRGLGGASNVWAAAPERSAAGGALLANDPHLGLSAPTIWYLARLELSSGGVIGATIPGMPAIIVGRSETLGWGVTAAYMDDMDFFVEQVNPDNPEEYLTPNGYESFETRREIIEVANGEPVTITLHWTENGPVIPSTHWNLGSITPEGHVMALSWTALSEANTSVQAGINLMRAQTVGEALQAGRDMVAPSQNLTVVDGQGNIALQTIGHMPRRMAGHQSQGRIPSPGWIAENRWRGVNTYSANPRFINPEGGLVGNTNNKTIDRDFPLHVSFSWGDTQRVTRWERLMQSRLVHTRDSFIDAQLDTVSAAAVNVLPVIARDLWFTGQTAPDGTPERRRQRALALLAEWDGDMNEHLPEPLIYAAWMRALQQRLIRDDLGPLADEYWQYEPLFLERVFRDIEGASVWCDVRQSSVIETCTDIARTALDDALQELEEAYGPALESWRWGAAHEAVHAHQVLGDTSLFSWIVNITQPTGGGDFTLNRAATSGEGPTPYRNTHSAGYRGVYDLADPDSSVFIIATGQSGHPFSRHYDDLGELWRRGEYIPMSLDPDLARAGNLGVSTLTPR